MRIVGSLVLTGTLILVSCGGGGSPASPTPPAGGGGTTTVTIAITGKASTNAFSPNPATVDAGQAVVFKNDDTVTHHVVLDDGSRQTADIPPGATSSAIAIGSNKSYHCSIHPGMVGGFNGAMGDPPPNCNQNYCGG